MNGSRISETRGAVRNPILCGLWSPALGSKIEIDITKTPEACSIKSVLPENRTAILRENRNLFYRTLLKNGVAVLPGEPQLGQVFRENRNYNVGELIL